MPDLELGCSLWQGKYRGASRQWLRWYDAQGNCLPTEAEMVQRAEQRAELSDQRAELSDQRAELAERRAQELAQRLQELGLEP